MRAALAVDLFDEIVTDGRHKLHALLPLLNSSAIKRRKFQLPKCKTNRVQEHLPA